MFSWPGFDAQLTWQSERTGRENNWSGRVVAVKAEAKANWSPYGRTAESERGTRDHPPCSANGPQQSL